jgi:hypothetical protein
MNLPNRGDYRSLALTVLGGLCVTMAGRWHTGQLCHDMEPFMSVILRIEPLVHISDSVCSSQCLQNVSVSIEICIPPGQYGPCESSQPGIFSVAQLT